MPKSMSLSYICVNLENVSIIPLFHLTSKFALLLRNWETLDKHEKVDIIGRIQIPRKDSAYIFTLSYSNRQRRILTTS